MNKNNFSNITNHYYFKNWTNKIISNFNHNHKKCLKINNRWCLTKNKNVNIRLIMQKNYTQEDLIQLEIMNNNSYNTNILKILVWVFPIKTHARIKDEIR